MTDPYTPTTAVYTGKWVQILDELACGTQRYDDAIQRSVDDGTDTFTVLVDNQPAIADAASAYERFYDRLSWDGWPADAAYRIKELRDAAGDSAAALRALANADGLVEVSDAFHDAGEAYKSVVNAKGDLYGLMGSPGPTPDCSGLD